LLAAEEELETQPDKINPDSKKVTDHLANDRTYLAWVRTGVSMMGLGVVIAKLRYIIGAEYPDSSGIVHAAQIGLWFAAAGVLTIVMSVFFFLQTQQEIRESRYRSRKLYVLILAGLTGSLGLAILWYLMQPVQPVTHPPAPAPEISR
jgi:putative membrane protein